MQQLCRPHPHTNLVQKTQALMKHFFSPSKYILTSKFPSLYRCEEWREWDLTNATRRVTKMFYIDTSIFFNRKCPGPTSLSFHNHFWRAEQHHTGQRPECPVNTYEQCDAWAGLSISMFPVSLAVQLHNVLFGTSALPTAVCKEGIVTLNQTSISTRQPFHTHSCNKHIPVCRDQRQK